MKQRHFCGIDFGTSNSVLYLIDPNTSSHPIVLTEPSVIYMMDDFSLGNKGKFIGNSAIQAYIQYSEKGRFIQSVKSLLSNASFNYTEIFGGHFHAVDLVALILSHLKEKAEALIGYSLTDVVMGRPVYFSQHLPDDQLAQTRLETAARLVGFQSISFQFEPVGAALAYEQLLTEEKTVLVADFGGGTTDFTVMRLNPQQLLSVNRKNDILSTGGVYIGGETFNSRIMWHELMPYFGYGSQFESMFKRYDIPEHFFTTLCHWYHIHHLKTDVYRQDLKDIYFGALNKQAIQKLCDLIDHDMGFSLFQAIQEAKHGLSHAQEADIQFPALSIFHPLSQNRFSEIIDSDIQAIRCSLFQTLEEAKLQIEDIQTVFLTGGTSLVKKVRAIFDESFPPHVIQQDDDLFISVAKGLSLAHRFVL